MKYLRNLSAMSFLLFGSFILGFGQKSTKCDVKGLQKPKFKIVSMFDTRVMGIRVTIEPKYQTDENLILLANYIKQKYCEKRLIIVI